MGETVEITSPTLSAHNLIIGTPYVDIGGTAVLRTLGDDDHLCHLNFIKRGWMSKEEFKVEGEVKRTTKKKEATLYKVYGNWNSKIFVAKCKNEAVVPNSEELVFEKNPYPEKWDYMYGMSHFSLQLNYFPSWIHNIVAPTDTRRRPDQRLLENGDMKGAAKEKDRLEKKQRAVRKNREANNIEHSPIFFEPVEVEEDSN